MRKRIQTTIEEKALKQLDIKIVNSDFLKNRSSYFEFLIRFLPFIPDDAKPDADINEIIQNMSALTGVGNSAASLAKRKPEGDVREISDMDQSIINMAKNFKLKIAPKETAK